MIVRYNNFIKKLNEAKSTFDSTAYVYDKDITDDIWDILGKYEEEGRIKGERYVNDYQIYFNENDKEVKDFLKSIEITDKELDVESTDIDIPDQEDEKALINGVPVSEVKKFNSMTDYTQLDPGATEEDILEITDKAKIIEPASICILPKMVSFAKKELKDTNILITTVISFPHGTDSLEEKFQETKKALEDGADEIDMVLDYPKLKQNWDVESQTVDKATHEYLLTDIKQLADLCHKEGAILKVIVESGLLDIPQTRYTTTLCIDAGADFIKTSTGKVSVGAEIEKVKAMKEVIVEEGSDLKIKASGGIRTIEDLRNFLPFVDRYGIGWGSVDKINGLTKEEKGGY